MKLREYLRARRQRRERKRHGEHRAREEAAGDPAAIERAAEAGTIGLGGGGGA